MHVNSTLLAGFARWLALLIALSAWSGPVLARDLDTRAAVRLVELLEQTNYRPTARELDRQYLQAGFDGVQLMGSRLESAGELAAAIRGNPAEYRRAVEVCVPALDAVNQRLDELFTQLQDMLQQPQAPKAYVVLGSGSSAGTADRRGVVIALEVLCRFVDSREDAVRLLESSLVHEAVHHYRFRVGDFSGEDSLLRQAMLEGFADWAAQQVTARPSAIERARDAFGRENETRLWRDFQADMQGLSLKHWMYGPGRPGEPADLGYWIGKQVSAAYYNQSAQPEGAISDLLVLEDPFAILKASGYAP